MTDTETVYVSKYALSVGIEKVSVRVPDNASDRYRYNAVGWVQYAPGTWHRDRADAEAAAEAMRAKKIVSLRRQIARLEKLSFVENPE